MGEGNVLYDWETGEEWSVGCVADPGVALDKERSASQIYADQGCRVVSEVVGEELVALDEHGWWGWFEVGDMAKRLR